MNCKYRWHNFADPVFTLRSAPTGGPQTLNLGGAGQPAASAVNAAQKKKVGGKAKKCTKGKSCSATCIAHGDECLVDFPPAVQEAIRKVAQKIISGQGITEGSAEDEELGKSLGEVFGVYGNSVTGIAKTGQTLYPPEIAAKYAQFQKDGKFAVQRTEISDDVVNQIWSALPRTVRDDLKSKGQPPKFIARDDERGKMILKTFLETGFRDEITGQPYSWREIQPDHRVPIAFFPGDKKADVEKNGNLVMVHKGYNQLKGSSEGKGAREKDPEEFVRGRLEEEFTKQARRTREEFDKLVGEAAIKDAGKSELKKQLAENSPLWSRDEWATQIRSLSGPALQMLASIQGKLGGVSNRFSPSHSQGRNFAPKYASAPVLQVALLTRQGVPIEKWPPGLITKAAKALRSDLGTLESRAQNEGRSGAEYKAHYKNKFKEFANSKLPPEIQSILNEAA